MAGQQQTPPGHEAPMRPRPDHGEHSYTGSGRLTDRVALITGGDSGIGKAVAIAFAREGADVLLSYFSEHDDARATADLVEQAGRRAVLAPGDLAEPAHCRELVDRALREFGELHVLVNNAGLGGTAPIQDMTDQQWSRVLDVTLNGTFRCTRAAIAARPSGPW